MHKSELKIHPVLISHANKEDKLRAGTNGPIWVMAPLESNFEIDSTSHYRDSMAL